MKALLEKTVALKEITNLDDTILYDFIIDRLTVGDILQVLATTEGGLRMHMLHRTPLFHLDSETGEPIIFYSMHESAYYSVTKGTTGVYAAKKLGVVERTKIKHQIQDIKAKIQRAISTQTRTQSYKAFVEKNKDDVIVFKIIDKNSIKGYVCAKTSSLLLSELKDRIKELLPSIDLSRPLMKATLCEVYELALRAQGNTLFKRPFAQKLI